MNKRTSVNPRILTTAKRFALVVFVALVAVFSWNTFSQFMLDNQLIAAVESNNPPAVRHLLAQAANPNVRQAEGPDGDSCDLPLNLCSCFSRTYPILLPAANAAEISGNTDILELLMKYGADPNIPCEIASESGNTERISTLSIMKTRSIINWKVVGVLERKQMRPDE